MAGGRARWTSVSPRTGAAVLALLLTAAFVVLAHDAAERDLLDLDHTAVPLELDEIYSSLDQLNVALGPNGANRNGALSDLLEVTAKNFGGQGAKFHQTIQDFSKLTQTLDDNKEELFGSARQLEGFISTLAKNDKTVRSFNQSLADASQMLSGERTELSASLHNLAIAMRQVSGFVKDNRSSLGRNTPITERSDSSCVRNFLSGSMAARGRFGTRDGSASIARRSASWSRA